MPKNQIKKKKVTKKVISEKGNINFVIKKIKVISTKEKLKK